MATPLIARTMCLRPFTTATRAFSPAPISIATFTTASTPSNTHRPQLPTSQSKLTTLRHTSTSTSSDSTIPSDLLTWDRFFALRRKRRWLNLGCSGVSSIATVGVAAPLIAQQDFDAWGAQISGLDPIVVLGISTFTIAAGGWLAGPAIGNLMFSLWAGRKGWQKGITEKEKSFYARIKRYRADASASSPQNPIPDYYGEKIGSVKDYRRWLKDQKAFNLKKNKNML